MLRWMVVTVFSLDLVLGFVLLKSAFLENVEYRAPQQETIVYVDHFCPRPRGCVTLLAWTDPRIDPRVRTALALAYTYADAPWRRYARQTATRRTRIVVRDIENAAAFYRSSDNVIVIDTPLVQEPTHVLASFIIGHEVVHAGLNTTYPNTRQGAGRCFAEELAAETFVVSLWEKLHHFGRQSPLATYLDTLTTHYANGTLHHHILLAPTYHKQCLYMELT